MTPVRSGDLYCPFCIRQNGNVGMDFTAEDHFWTCSYCHCVWRWDHDGTDWIYPDGRKPNPGCPWCGTANIDVAIGTRNWRCRREMCGRTWRGSWKQFRNGSRRWTIRIPVDDVPSYTR